MTLWVLFAGRFERLVQINIVGVVTLLHVYQRIVVHISFQKSR